MNSELSWNEYFINIAYEVSNKSKDPSTKVGAVIVDQDNRPVSFGFNGFIAGCDESYMTWERPMKYNLVLHAEMNALMFAKNSVRGCRIYTTQAPCENCLKHLLQAGIIEIYYDKENAIVDRGSKDQKEAIIRLINSLGNSISVMNIKGDNYVDVLIKSEITLK